jgi:hypothetical protein
VVLPPQNGPTAPPQPQGHGKSDPLPEGLPIWARPPTGNPFVAYPGAVQAVPGRFDENLILNALRQRGVPESDLYAAAVDPEEMQRLIEQNFGHDAQVRDAESAKPPGTPGDDQKAAAAAQTPSWGDIASDVGRSAVSGLEESGIGLVGKVGDFRDAASAVADYLGNKFGLDPETMDQFRNYASKVSRYTHLADAPTTNEVRSSFESVMGTLYQPKTGYGRVAHTLGEYGSALVGPGDLLLPSLVVNAVKKIPERLITHMVAPALTSEGAGYLAKDSKYESAARIAGAVVGGGGAANTAREIKNASIAPAIRQLDDTLWKRSEPLRTAVAGGVSEHKYQPRRVYIQAPWLRTPDQPQGDDAR